MKRTLLAVLILCCAAFSSAQSSQERGHFSVTANSGSRVTVLRFYFAVPFKSAPSCTASFVHTGMQHEHGAGEIQETARAYVQIAAEVGEDVSWSCTEGKP